MACPVAHSDTKTLGCAFSVLALDLPFTFGSCVPVSSLIRSVTVLTTQWPTCSELTVGLGCFHS